MNDKPLSLAFVVPSLGEGGAERVTVDLANAMVARGIETFVVTTGRAGTLRTQLDAKVTVVEVGAAGVGSAIPRLAKIIRIINVDTLVSIMDHTNLAVWTARSVARSGARLVFTSHVDCNFAFRELPGWLRGIVVALYRLIYRRADARIAVSDGVAASLASVLRVPRAAIDVVYNPAVTDRIHELAQREPPPELLPRSGSYLVVAMGRLVPQKDFETLLGAFAIAARKAPLQLVIMGEGPQRTYLEHLIAQHGLTDDVAMPGFVENPFALLRHARVFVSSSRFEGFGIAIVEAMALGIPVVATACPSGPAEILGGGRYGTLVEVGDVDALATALLHRIADPGPIDLARVRAREFGISAAADTYVRIASGARGAI